MNYMKYAVRSTEHLEHISWEGKPLAYIIRAEMSPEKTTFLSRQNSNSRWDLSLFRWRRNPAPRPSPIGETSSGYFPKVLVVRRGRCEIDILQ